MSRGAHIIREDPVKPVRTRESRGSWIEKALVQVAKKADGQWYRLETYENKSSASSTASAIRTGKHMKGFEAKTAPVKMQDGTTQYGVYARTEQEEN